MTTTAAASAAVNDLLLALPNCKTAHELYGLFADKVSSIFAEVTHISMLLLPAEQPSTTPPQPASAAPGSSSSTSSSRGAGRSSRNTAATHTPSKNAAAAQHANSSSHDASAELTSKLQAFRAGCGLDWSNCCVFNLYARRGPVVQAPPPWPVTCTATCYAAVTVQDVLTTGNYAADGPHFLDWKALAEQGNVSMAAVPMYSCNKPVAVLCMASKQADAFSSVSTLRLLGGLLAPYCSMLTYSTRLTEMRRLVNEIIAPIAAQLAQQKHSQLAKLGCTVEEAPPGSVAADGKGISVAVGSQGRNSSSSSSSDAAQAEAAGCSTANAASSGASLRQRKGHSSSKSSAAGSGSGGKGSSSNKTSASAAAGAITQCISEAQHAQGLSHKRFESVIVKGGGGYESDGFSSSPDNDLDWSDFFFNLVSMVIVYVYFSRTAAAGESMVAILLCMGVAGLDILLMALRWLWFDHYVAYGNMVVTLLQAYRVIVLPVANTWMSWSLLHTMSITPSGPLIVLLGVILVLCILMGLQVRFFLHAPLQLASVLFAAMSTPEICGAFFESTSNIRCVGIISALQLSLGLFLPSACVYFLEGRSGRAFLPHMQAKRWLMTA